MTKDDMKAKIAIKQEEIAALEKCIEDFDSAIERNQYESHQIAEDFITERYSGIASEACEGSYCYGDEKYTQLYQIDGDTRIFEATVSFEYNRHDKQYYYVDGQDYSYKELESAA